MDRQQQFEQRQMKMTDSDLLELVSNKLGKICETGGRALTMSVPPSVDDFDMLVCELMRRYKEKISE